MNRHIIYSVFFVTFLLSCKHSTTSKEEKGKEILFHQENLKTNWLFSELFDTVEFVPLETREACLIKKITKLQVIKDRIYVLDQGTHAVYVFNKQGKYLWKINSIGRGPQEYNKIIDFDISPDNMHLYLFANYPSKLMEYDSLGTFIKEEKIELNGNSIAVQDNYLNIHTANILNTLQDKQTTAQLLIKQLDNDSIWEHIPAVIKNPGHSCLVYQYAESFQHSGKEILFWCPFESKIYSINKEKVKSKYRINFGKYTLPVNLSTDQIPFSEYAHGLNSYWENNKFAFFMCTVNHGFYHFIYDKTKEQLYYGNLKDDISGCLFPRIVAATDSHMVAYSDAFTLFENDKYWKDKQITDKKISNLLAHIDENDNPVVFLYQFKTN